MIKIRRTKLSDIKTLSKIYKEVYDKEKVGETWNYEKAKSLLLFYYNVKTFIGLTVLVDKKIVGAFFSYIKPWCDGKHLAEGEIFIDPKFQGKRIGTKLYLEMMKTAYKKGCRIHELVAYNKPASWYQKIGFRKTKLNHMSGDIKEVIKKINKQQIS
ncbi:hypothetical protein A2108_01165 [Candidatus Wolfebacteria bacterium GWA1_42_9]|uniref:N-acetyltransferase domain-containing protein n=1 Tax=Candidatus Wolfebacteria bacterium GWA1_42_9 TaxID=1802553 RepID=A0A1F8DP12_9BACT|nr:MAG: hypothetical protein A2108_01165 [Candidatus Wolfebacteria bacterium GWA1_42_9]